MRNGTQNLVAMSIGAAGVGAALMFLLDPARGNRRRSLLRDKMLHIAKRTGWGLGKASRDLGNRTRGLIAETQSRASQELIPDDDVLAERVRSKIGRYVSHPSAIDVSVDDGIVTLRGEVLRSEIRDVMHQAYAVRDVCEVRNQLKAHADEEGIPGLQGKQLLRRSAAFNAIRRSPGWSLALGAAGGALAIYAAASNRRTLARMLR